MSKPAAPETTPAPKACDHGHRLRFCRECHRQVCDARHDSYRGWGCDEHDHEHCTGFTRGYETFMCDCICCCRSWPEPKPAPAAPQEVSSRG